MQMYMTVETLSRAARWQPSIAYGADETCRTTITEARRRRAHHTFALVVVVVV